MCPIYLLRFDMNGTVHGSRVSELYQYGNTARMGHFHRWHRKEYLGQIVILAKRTIL